MLQVHLAVHYDGIVVLTECLRLRAGVVEAFGEQIATADWAGKTGKGRPVWGRYDRVILGHRSFSFDVLGFTVRQPGRGARMRLPRWTCQRICRVPGSRAGAWSWAWLSRPR